MPDLKHPIFLNHATAAALHAVDGLGPKDVETLIAGRPYRSWAEVERSGVAIDGVKALQSQGVDLGAPGSGPLGEPGSGGHGGVGGVNLGQA